MSPKTSLKNIKIPPKQIRLGLLIHFMIVSSLMQVFKTVGETHLSEIEIKLQRVTKQYWQKLTIYKHFFPWINYFFSTLDLPQTRYIKILFAFRLFDLLKESEMSKMIHINIDTSTFYDYINELSDALVDKTKSEASYSFAEELFEKTKEQLQVLYEE